MSGDFTRSTFDPKKNFSAVLHEAGGLVVDADLNEQRHIEHHDARQARIDIIGRAGAPEGNAGLEVTPAGTDLTIGAGRYYLDGIRIEWPEDVAFSEQVHEPEIPTDPGLYLAVLHVWERPVDAISDPTIREVALGGPAPSVRTEVVAQVELLPVTSDSATPTCATEFPEWDALLAATPPRMQVRLAEGSSDDPCSIPEDAGYRGLENRLYRVEVHDGNFDPTHPGAEDASIAPSFLWSRDNGSTVASWIAHDGAVRVTIDRLGPGGTQGFAPGDRIELTHDGWLLSERPGLIAIVAEVDATVLTLEDPGGTLGGELATTFGDAIRPRVRRWDSPQPRALAVAPAELGVGDVTADGWIRLEAGIEVRFDDGIARTGDYWELPARTAALPGTTDRQLDWPYDAGAGAYEWRGPDGVAHHYGRLAVLQLGGGGWSLLDDCRPTFPPLTELPQPGGNGSCGEIAVEPGTDVINLLLGLDAAVLDDDGALVPGPAGDSLALCFRPGDHPIGNLAFARWRSLRLTGLQTRAVTLHGRLRVRRSANVELRGLRVIDLGLEGQRLPAVDDDGDAAFRWRTRVVEVRQSTDVTIERIEVQYVDPRWRLKDGQALHVSDARDVRIRDCVISAPRGQNGIRVQDADRAMIEGNRVLQDWAQSLALDGLSGPERRELASWAGRLVFDFGSVHARTDRYARFELHHSQRVHDRRAYRVGFGPGGERYWAARATVLGFSSRTLPTGLDARRSQLDQGAASLMRQVADSWDFSNLLPAGTSTDAGDLQVSRHILQHEVQTRRAALGAALLSGGASRPGRRPGRGRNPFGTLVNRMRATPLLAALRERLITEGRWVVGLGGTGIRVARTRAADVLRGTICIRDNWVENFPVGIDGTWKQEHVAQDDIQRLDIVGNALRLHSPLLPLQRGGIIAGGARRVRVDDNDIDVREGSSHSINRSRGWFVGVDGIRIRGRVGAWVGVRGNHVRGCAVGLRSVHNDAVDPIDTSPTRVLTVTDNAYVGCDFDTL
ncbi:MAG: DUF6519 domain-containing protein [Nannocystaceae bacterium]|nr:DUF4815 domain-containing protein [bacterium]